MSSEWKRLLWVSRFTILLTFLLMAVSLFFPAFQIEQEMRSEQNTGRYSHQTNGFRPWFYTTDLETTVVNETELFNVSEPLTQDSYSTYSGGWAYIIPIISTTLMMFALAGSFVVGILLFVHKPGNRRRSVFTYLLFYPVVFSCILLSAVFFFLIPRIVYLEMDVPEAYTPDFPLPPMGSAEGSLSNEGYGSGLGDLRPLYDPDTYSYGIRWQPGPALYMYFGAFILSLFGFIFYGKMRRLRKQSTEQDVEGGEEAPVLADGIALEEGMEEVSEVEAADEAEAPILILGEEAADEAEAVSAKPVPLEQQAAPAVSVKEPGPAPAAAKAPAAPPPVKKKARGSEDEELAESAMDFEAAADAGTGPKGRVRVIELGEKDFEQGPVEEQLEIKGLREVMLECPGCSRRFRASLEERIICPHCGLEGDVD